jgi:hypothetical protein
MQNTLWPAGVWPHTVATFYTAVAGLCLSSRCSSFASWDVYTADIQLSCCPKLCDYICIY